MTVTCRAVLCTVTCQSCHVFNDLSELSCVQWPIESCPVYSDLSAVMCTVTCNSCPVYSNLSELSCVQWPVRAVLHLWSVILQCIIHNLFCSVYSDLSELSSISEMEGVEAGGTRESNKHKSARHKHKKKHSSHHHRRHSSSHKHKRHKHKSTSNKKEKSVMQVTYLNIYLAVYPSKLD